MADLKLLADSGGGTVSLKAPSATTSNQAVTLKLPVADGSANQLLKTDGSGQLGWATDSTTDSTKLPLAGGSLSGSLTINNPNILKVNGIRGTGASSDAITINSTDGTCTAKITNNLSNRNLIINGAMQVAQRGTSSTSNGYGDLDRWQHEYGTVNENPTFAQVDITSGTPFDLGFRKAIKITNGNQTSGLQAASQINLMQPIEAQNIAQSGWNYKSASSYITLSFWVKSSVGQTFYGFVKTADGSNYHYPFSTGALSADTWTKVTKKIPGNTNLQIDNNTGAGFQVFLQSTYGTDYTSSGVTLDAWAAWSSSARTPDQTATWFTTNDSTLEFTGVQLEISDHATEFEHEPEQVTFTKCQRYFQYWFNAVRFPSTSSANHATYHFPTPMRAAPTVVRTGDQAGSYESGSTTGLMVSNSQYKYYYSGLLSYGNSSDKAVGGYGTLDSEL